MVITIAQKNRPSNFIIIFLLWMIILLRLGIKCTFHLLAAKRVSHVSRRPDGHATAPTAANIKTTTTTTQQ